MDGNAIGLRVHARVDAAAVAHNLAALRARLGPASAARIWATVKADAYGHGLHRVLPGLAGADGLAVSQLADARACRAAGWNGPLLVLGGLLDAEEAQRLALPDLHLALSHDRPIDWLGDAPSRAAPPWIWLRYAGDIGYTGFDDAGYAEAYRRCTVLARQGRIAGIAHLNHYGRAEQPDGIAQADARFQALIRDLPGPRSFCNSAALLRHPDAARSTDWVRPGIALYGASPLPDIDGPALGLRPAMSLHTRIIGIRDVAKGERLGYNGSIVAAAPMRVGMVASGYGDGYPRRTPAGTPVLVDGHIAPTLGAVTMDLIPVDLTGLPPVAIGAPVVLWGTPELPVEKVARHMGTIAAELLTSLTPRVPVIPVPMAGPDDLEQK
ncbi:alanine racemase [Bordetella genomosp. 8]|uniref:Alanine racemase n=1 Tax=Bordetella genomosp. 8 TaxID=1416806 RepID=A0A1W6YLP0_9BORD|nr:alanine racemase [Bordetella genomosp. 8]ARP81985.1 alanine racemase [Bordetella genomosp. 8]